MPDPELVEELGLQDSERFSDDVLIALMVAHPRLVQRPIVARGDRAVLRKPRVLVPTELALEVQSIEHPVE